MARGNVRPSVETSKKQVFELHRFLEDWYNGALAPTEENLARFATLGQGRVVHTDLRLTVDVDAFEGGLQREAQKRSPLVTDQLHRAQASAKSCMLVAGRSIIVEKINVAEKLAQFDEHWSPRIIAELNGQHVKLAKLQGPFVWHHHEEEDELFLVVVGRLKMELRDQTIELEAGELLVVPRGVEHRPVADEEAHVLLFEPVSTLNTGNVEGERTVRELKTI